MSDDNVFRIRIALVLAPLHFRGSVDRFLDVLALLVHCSFVVGYSGGEWGAMGFGGVEAVQEAR